jgi:hypothetical protein
MKMTIKKTTKTLKVEEELLYKRELAWAIDKTAFIELAYALYETRAIQIIGNKKSKKFYIEKLAEMFGIDDIHNHAIIHSKKLSKPIESHFPFILHKIYERYINNLLEKDSILYKPADYTSYYPITEPPSDVTSNAIHKLLQETIKLTKKTTEHIEIQLEEITPHKKPFPPSKTIAG